MADMEMEMETDDETLVKLAAGGSMDYSTWPLLLSTIVSRIEKIAYNDFPIPRIPQPVAAPPPPPPPEPRFLAPLPSSDPADASSTQNEAGSTSTGSSQETNKENAAPTPTPPTTSAPAATAAPPPLEPGTMPPQIVAMVAEITGILNESFHTYPPHTIQRLAELVLLPRQHYKSLPSYLHAVDRVVHVTSGNNLYPLPPAIPDMSPMSLSGPNGVVDQGPLPQENGVDTSLAWASTSNGNGSVGSDEALGGALLTPIPWLQRRATDGGSESGESSTLGSEGGPSPLSQGQGPPPQQRSQPQTGRQFETRTESTETIDGPNGVGSIETVVISVNGMSSIGAGQQQRVITQGELIRQEQRAGVVPVSQLQRAGPLVVTSSSSATPSATPPAAGEPAAAASETDTKMDDGEAPKEATNEKPDEEMADEEEGPHARGPDIIGAADMGPQNPTSSTFSISSGGNVEMRGIDVEAAVGRKAGETSSTPEISSEDESAVMTPSSSSEDAADQGKDSSEDKAGKTKDTAQKKEDEKEEDDSLKRDEAQHPEDAETTPSSATLSARASPTPSKRGAEDDADAESASSKRLRGEDETAGDSAAAGTAPAQEEPARPEEEEKEGKADGDIALPDRAAQAPAGGADAATAANTGADGQKEIDRDEAKPDESTG
ncbi:hypothetical protein VMCG_03641 [Cytospora schulzeri]|uniref:Protein phosphatase 4 core regulatory subunit R2 n=1 Tax=Cytospora schulzeri TaxID=448051 RepID=A0A423WWW5_9PEZI|nr:hypothetical protein VMCG_03641 [Valsa malicola]